MTSQNASSNAPEKSSSGLDTKALRQQALKRNQTYKSFGLGTYLIPLITLWAIGFLCYACYISFIQKNEDVSADAIVILTGSSQRIENGIDLLRNGHAPKLLVSGVDSKLSVNAFASTYNLSPKLMKSITLDYAATNTAENAQEAKKWLADRDATSIILVTANYHLPRSAIEFHAVLPNMTIYLHSVASDEDNSFPLWPFTAKPKFMLTEYHKIYISICRFLVAKGTYLARRYNFTL